MVINYLPSIVRSRSWWRQAVATLCLLAFVIWLQGRGWHFEVADGFTLLGHLSFAITFLSYAQRNIVKLRLLAIASLAIGLVYNGWVHLRVNHSHQAHAWKELVR